MRTVERLSYFSFYPADYLLDTTDLTLAEHGAYLVMMIRYYWEGQILEKDKYRNCRTEEDKRATDAILTRFFHVEDGRIIHHRIEREFEALARFVEHQSKAGKASAEARRAKKRVTKINGDHANAAQVFNSFWEIYPKKVAKGAAEIAWKKVRTEDYAVVIAAVESQKKTWKEKRFIPNPATWINSKRWLDETAAPQESFDPFNPGPGKAVM